MKIKPSQMKALRAVLSKEDKTFIAQQANMSYRTVEAVLNGSRSNDELEILIFRRARMISIALSDAVRSIELANEAVSVSLEDYQCFKVAVGSDDGEANKLYMETYLHLSHRTFTPEQLWETLATGHKKLIKHGLYCTLLIQKLCGVGDDVAVKVFNNGISGMH